MAAAKAAQSEMYQALLSRRSALVIEFEKKAARYKEILIKEMVSFDNQLLYISAVHVYSVFEFNASLSLSLFLFISL